MPESYNGYYNYEVWNVMLYIDNDYSDYQKMEKLFGDYYEKKISKAKFDSGINQLGRSAHLKSDVKNQKLSKTEIAQLRKELNERYRDYAKYRKESGK